MPQTPEERRAKDRAYSRTYRMAHKEEVAAKKRAHRLAHKAELAARDHAYKAAHKAEVAVRNRAYYMTHKEQVAVSGRTYRVPRKAELASRSRAYRVAQKENVAARKRAYNAAHKEEIQAMNRAYRVAHPEVAATHKARRRARQAGAAINDLTTSQWREILAAYDHRCVYCGRTMQRLEKDHITPLSKGGTHTFSNIIPACKSCNSKKGTRAPIVPVQPLLLTIAASRRLKRRSQVLPEPQLS